MKIFDDLLISYRGAGVIGTCLAFFVLASVIGLSLFAFDPDLSGISESSAAVAARQEREIGRLNQSVEDAQKRYDAHRDTLHFAEEVRENVARQEVADGKLQTISAEIEKVQGELDAQRARHESYASAYREQLREKAVGEVWPTLELTDGRRFESAKVLKVDPAGIRISHRDGSGRVLAKDLPGALRERFQFQAEEMERFLEAEKAKAGKLEQDIERGLVEIKSSSRKEKIARLEKQSAFLKNRVAACARQYAALRPAQNRHYNTLVMLINQVDADEKAIRKVEAELAVLKAEEK